MTISVRIICFSRETFQRWTLKCRNVVGFAAKQFSVGLRLIRALYAAPFGRAYGRAWPALTKNSWVDRSSSTMACMRS